MSEGRVVLERWRRAAQEAAYNPVTQMAEHARGSDDTCQRCTARGVGNHAQAVLWPCGPYLFARHKAHEQGLAVPDDGLPPQQALSDPRG